MNNVTHHKIGMWVKIRMKIRRHRLAFALGLAISIALLLVCVSVNVYVLAGFSRYDLSRPGYEKERQEVKKPAPIKSYDTTSTITSQTTSEFLTEFDSRLQDIKALGNLRDTSLNDNEIGVNDDSTNHAADHAEPKP